MVTNTVQIVFERSDLSTWIIHIFTTPLLSMWDVSRKVQSFHGEDYVVFRFIPEYTVLGREPLELDDDDWRQSSDCQRFRSSTGDFTTWAIPFIVSVHNFTGNEIVDEFLDDYLVFTSGDREGDVHECIVRR